MRRVGGQDSIGPSGVFAQSIERMSSPISPPPTSQSRVVSRGEIRWTTSTSMANQYETRF